MKNHTVVKNAFEAGYFDGCKHASDLIERVKNLLGRDSLPYLQTVGHYIVWVEDGIEIQLLIGYSEHIYINMYALPVASDEYLS